MYLRRLMPRDEMGRTMEAYEQLAREGFSRYRAHATRLGLPGTVVSALAPDARFNHDRSFLAFAYLLRDAFSGIPTQDLHAIADATYCGARAALDLDRLLDRGGGRPNQSAWLTVQHFQMAQQRLSVVFATDHPFWRDYTELLREHCERCGDESTLTSRTAPDAELFQAIAIGKATLIRLPVIAMAHAAGRLDLVAPMCEVLALEQVGTQWRDDVVDVADDLSAGQVTLVTQRLRLWWEEQGEAELPSDPTGIKQALHGSGVSLRMFEDIERVYQRVVPLAQRVMPAAYLTFLSVQVERNRRSLEGMRSLLAHRPGAQAVPA